MTKDNNQFSIKGQTDIFGNIISDEDKESLTYLRNQRTSIEKKIVNAKKRIDDLESQKRKVEVTIQSVEENVEWKNQQYQQNQNKK